MNDEHEKEMYTNKLVRLNKKNDASSKLWSANYAKKLYLNAPIYPGL